MSDIKVRNNTCSLPNCHREVFENSKCILHCEKDDWFVIDKKGYKDWRQSEDKIKEFWRVVYDLWGRGKSLKNVVFPPIDDSDKLSNNKGSDLRTKKGILFEFDNFLKISDSTFLGDFRLNCKFKFKSILFEKTKFLGKLEINNVTIEIELRFNNITFNKKTNFIMLNCRELVFYNTTFSEISYFHHIRNLKKLEIANSPKIKNISIRECNIDSVDICNNKVFNEIEIVNTSIIEHLKLSNRWINTFSFKGCKLNNITILGELAKQVQFDGSDKGSDFEINDCTFNDDSYIVIKKLYINNFKIIDNDNISDAFCIYDTIIENKIRFEYTNITNFEFHNCDVSCASKKFINIAFQGNNGFTIFNGVNWGDIGKTFDTDTDRDTFRQLKYVNEKQGNIIEANKFYSAEMNEYQKELFRSKCYQRLQDKFIFCANKVISNFSQSWILPLVWYVIFGFNFSFIYYSDYSFISNFSMLLISLFLLSIVIFFIEFFKYKNFRISMILLPIVSCINYFYNIRNEAFIKLFDFINPFNTSGLDDKEGRLIWWILFRIISVFIIYQFIISLRRQTRR